VLFLVAFVLRCSFYAFGDYLIEKNITRMVLWFPFILHTLLTFVLKLIDGLLIIEKNNNNIET